jgi:hypothetical protein
MILGFARQRTSAGAARARLRRARRLPRRATRRAGLSIDKASSLGVVVL